MEYLDALVLELAVRYPDFYVLDLFEFEQYLLVKKCKDIKFGAQQEEYYSDDDVRSFLSEDALQQLTSETLSEMKDQLNNKSPRQEAKVMINNKEYAGYY